MNQKALSFPLVRCWTPACNLKQLADKLLVLLDIDGKAAVVKEAPNTSQDADFWHTHNVIY